MDKELRVIVSGGGTGGHIFPAVSIANAIKAKRPEAKILFVGALGRMEMQRVPAAGYEIKGLPVRGFIRPLWSPRNIGVALDFLKSKRMVRSTIKEFRPDVAVGVGGYASGATLDAASAMGIPCLIQEQNSYAGVTNKMLAKKAAKICVAYDGMERFFPADKIIKTGNPVRQSLLETTITREEAIKSFGLDPQKKTILLVGGSLGARTINESVMRHLDLVESIAFPNAGGELKAAEASKIVATVPEKAQEGDISLTLANGKQVTVAYSLVKPTVTECTPNTLVAGNKVIIKGTDLDLVESVTLPGDPAQTVSEFAAQNAKAIALVIPTACAGSGLTLNLKNGTSVEASGLTIQAATAPAISEAPAKIIIGEKATIKGKNFYNVEAIYLGSVKVTKIISKTNEEITFQVPEMATGEVEINFVTPDGTKVVAGKIVVDVPEIDFATFAKDEQQTGFVSWPFNFSWGDSAGKMRIFRADLLAMNLQSGKSKIIVYKTAGVTGQIQVNNANWGSITTIADWDGSAERIEWIVDDTFIDAINNVFDGWSDTALILQGDLAGVQKMTILP